MASTMWDGVWTSFSDLGARESTRAAFLAGLGRDLPDTWRCKEGHETPGDEIGMSTGEFNNVVTPLPVCPEPGCRCIGDDLIAVDSGVPDSREARRDPQGSGPWGSLVDRAGSEPATPSSPTSCRATSRATYEFRAGDAP